ncbi:hypothetical protein BESB_056420 [Besnoitia besnoiti]|uniref:FH2 domain-containing protein n=1 Tax=Besnoitia besnoiti TaxID=94643 RepID=A0A2A9MIA8_BESBE|nr:hypothetical protein BESB_056420 [Besnoitia besnoiti]PFH35991.1 hypothetical protein BESB_056420 [Besnoitia besnoiti]
MSLSSFLSLASACEPCEPAVLPVFQSVPAHGLPPPPAKGKKGPPLPKSSKLPPAKSAKAGPPAGGQPSTPSPPDASAEKAPPPAENLEPHAGKPGPPAGKGGPPAGKGGPPAGKVGLPKAASGPETGRGSPDTASPGAPAAKPALAAGKKPAPGKSASPPGSGAPFLAGPAPTVPPVEERSTLLFKDSQRVAGVLGADLAVTGGGMGKRDEVAARAAMIAEKLTLADFANMPVATARGAEPPPLPLTADADRNPFILTTELRKDMAERRHSHTQTEEERIRMLSGMFNVDRQTGFRLTPEHQRVAEALTLLQRLEDFRGTVRAGEVQRARYLLRVGAIEAFAQQRYSEAMLQALHSYFLAKSYYTAYESMPLEGEMVPELLLLAKCCGLAGCLDRGQEYLDELRYIVENTLIFISTGGSTGAAGSAGSSAAGGVDRGSVQGPILQVEKHVLASVVSSLAEICSLYNQPDNAKLFYEKYVILTKDVYGADSLAVSDALNTVALYFFRTRQYEQALPIVEEVLDIRKKHLGDYDAPEPNARVADCYANLGLLYRLLGRPIDAFPLVLTCLDMRMRIFQTRETAAVQDLVLSLGCLQHQAGHFREALDAYKEVWGFRNRTLGATHPDTINVEILLRRLDKDLTAWMEEEKQKMGRRETALPSAGAFDAATRAGSAAAASKSHRTSDVFYEEDDDYDLTYDDKRVRKAIMDYADAAAAVRLLKCPTAVTLEEFRYQQTAKGLKFRVRGIPFHSLARRRALYGEEWRSMMVPSSAILPYVGVEVTGPDTLELAECYEFQEALAAERPKLPVVNVPQIERGEATIVDGQPHMVVNPEAADLLRDWGVVLPEVDREGRVINRDPQLTTEKGFQLFVPVVDPTTNQPFLGFFGEPVMVPNPAIYHAVIAPAIADYEKREEAAREEEHRKKLLAASRSGKDGRIIIGANSGQPPPAPKRVSVFRFGQPGAAGALPAGSPPPPGDQAEAGDTPMKGKSNLASPESPVKQATSTLKQGTSTLKQATSTLKQATSNLKQETSTLKQETSTLKQATSTLKQAKSTLKQAKSNLKQATSNLKQATSNLKEGKSTLKDAKARLAQSLQKDSPAKKPSAKEPPAKSTSNLKNIPQTPPKAEDASSSSEEEPSSSEDEAKAGKKAPPPAPKPAAAKPSPPAKKTSPGLPAAQPSAGAKPKSLLGGSSARFDAAAYKSKMKKPFGKPKGPGFQPATKHAADLPPFLSRLETETESAPCSAKGERSDLREWLDTGCEEQTLLTLDASYTTSDAAADDDAGEFGVPSPSQLRNSTIRTKEKRERREELRGLQDSATSGRTLPDSHAGPAERQISASSSEVAEGTAVQGAKAASSSSSLQLDTQTSPPHLLGLAGSLQGTWSQAPRRKREASLEATRAGLLRTDEEEEDWWKVEKEDQKCQVARTKEHFKKLLLKKQREHLDLALTRLQLEQAGEAAPPGEAFAASSAASRRGSERKGGMPLFGSAAAPPQPRRSAGALRGLDGLSAFVSGDSAEGSHPTRLSSEFSLSLSPRSALSGNPPSARLALRRPQTLAGGGALDSDLAGGLFPSDLSSFTTSGSHSASLTRTSSPPEASPAAARRSHRGVAPGLPTPSGSTSPQGDPSSTLRPKRPADAFAAAPDALLSPLSSAPTPLSPRSDARSVPPASSPPCFWSASSSSSSSSSVSAGVLTPAAESAAAANEANEARRLSNAVKAAVAAARSSFAASFAALGATAKGSVPRHMRGTESSISAYMRRPDTDTDSLTVSSGTDRFSLHRDNEFSDFTGTRRGDTDSERPRREEGPGDEPRWDVDWRYLEEEEGEGSGEQRRAADSARGVAAARRREEETKKITERRDRMLWEAGQEREEARRPLGDSGRSGETQERHATERRRPGLGASGSFGGEPRPDSVLRALERLAEERVAHRGDSSSHDGEEEGDLVEAELSVSEFSDEEGTSEREEAKGSGTTRPRHLAVDSGRREEGEGEGEDYGEAELPLTPVAETEEEDVPQEGDAVSDSGSALVPRPSGGTLDADPSLSFFPPLSTPSRESPPKSGWDQFISFDSSDFTLASLNSMSKHQPGSLRHKQSRSGGRGRPLQSPIGSGAFEGDWGGRELDYERRSSLRTPAPEPESEEPGVEDDSKLESEDESGAAEQTESEEGEFDEVETLESRRLPALFARQSSHGAAMRSFCEEEDDDDGVPPADSLPVCSDLDSFSAGVAPSPRRTESDAASAELQRVPETGLSTLCQVASSDFSIVEDEDLDSLSPEAAAPSPAPAPSAGFAVAGDCGLSAVFEPVVPTSQSVSLSLPWIIPATPPSSAPLAPEATDDGGLDCEFSPPHSSRLELSLRPEAVHAAPVLSPALGRVLRRRSSGAQETTPPAADTDSDPLWSRDGPGASPSRCVNDPPSDRAVSNGETDAAYAGPHDTPENMPRVRRSKLSLRRLSQSSLFRSCGSLKRESTQSDLQAERAGGAAGVDQPSPASRTSAGSSRVPAGSPLAAPVERRRFSFRETLRRASLSRSRNAEEELSSPSSCQSPVSFPSPASHLLPNTEFGSPEERRDCRTVDSISGATAAESEDGSIAGAGAESAPASRTDSSHQRALDCAEDQQGAIDSPARGRDEDGGQGDRSAATESEDEGDKKRRRWFSSGLLRPRKTLSDVVDDRKKIMERRHSFSRPPLPPDANASPSGPSGLRAPVKERLTRLRRRSVGSASLAQDAGEEKTGEETGVVREPPRLSPSILLPNGLGSRPIHTPSRGLRTLLSPFSRKGRGPTPSSAGLGPSSDEKLETGTGWRVDESSDDSQEEAAPWSEDDWEVHELPDDAQGDSGAFEEGLKREPDRGLIRPSPEGDRSPTYGKLAPCPDPLADPCAERPDTNTADGVSECEWNTSDGSEGSSSAEGSEAEWQEAPLSSSPSEESSDAEADEETYREEPEAEGGSPDRGSGADDEDDRIAAEGLIERMLLAADRWRQVEGESPPERWRKSGLFSHRATEDLPVPSPRQSLLGEAQRGSQPTLSSPLLRERRKRQNESTAARKSSQQPTLEAGELIPHAMKKASTVSQQKSSGSSSPPSVDTAPSALLRTCRQETLSFGGPLSSLSSAPAPWFLTQPVHELPPKGPKGGPPKKGKAAGWKAPPPLPAPKEEGAPLPGGTVLKTGIFKKAEAPAKTGPPEDNAPGAPPKDSKLAPAGKDKAAPLAKKSIAKQESGVQKDLSAAKPGPPEKKGPPLGEKKGPPRPPAKKGAPALKTQTSAGTVVAKKSMPKSGGDSSSDEDKDRGRFKLVKLPEGKPVFEPKPANMRIVVSAKNKISTPVKKAEDTKDRLFLPQRGYALPHKNLAPVSVSILPKIKKIKAGTEKDPTKGDVPVVILMDDNNQELGRLPWQVDLTSFSLAQSSMSVLVARKLGLLARRVEDEEKGEDAKEWLTGEGLKQFGLSMRKSKAGTLGGFGGQGLGFGMGLGGLPGALAQMQAKEPPKKEEAKAKEEPKKEAPKKGPPAGKGKGPPGKGPPKGKGPKKKGEGGLKVGKKDEGKTKRFFWDPLFEDEIPGTIFMKKPAVQLVLQDVEETFAKVVAKKKAESKKPKIIQLLPDSKRAYNMNIALSKFNNYSYQELREALIDLNPKILTIDATETLLNFVPTAEETQVVKEYINSGGDLKLVDRPEQFVAAMLGVPLMKQRLEAHAYALNFREAYSDAYTPLENLADACDALDDSQNLKVVLFAILELGNALNEGDPQRGGASGFKPTTLAKLQELRTTTKPVRTMLQYICDIIWEQKPTALSIYEDLKICDKAQRVDLQGVEGKISLLKAGLTKAKNTLEAARKGNESTGVMGDRDPLGSIMDEFIEEAEPKIKQLDDFLQQVQNQFVQTCHYAGYPEKDVKKVKPDELFKQIAAFARQVETIRKQKQELLDREMKRKEAEAKRASKGLKTATKKIGAK